MRIIRLVRQLDLWVKKMFEDLRAKFRFWYVRKFFLYGKHYVFMFDMSDKEAMAVRFLKKYPGVIAEYKNICMSSDREMSYDFVIIANPNLCDVGSKRFKNFASDVFRSIINDSIKNAIKEQDENRNTDLVELDSERTVHEEVLTVFEERVPQRKPRKKTVRRNKKVHSEVQQSAADSSVGDQS